MHLFTRLRLISPVHRSYIPIATQRQLTNGKETGAIGGLVYVLKTSAIQNMSDVRGKRIGVGTIWASGGYQLGVQELLYRGINIYAHASQVSSGFIEVGNMAIKAWHKMCSPLRWCSTKPTTLG